MKISFLSCFFWLLIFCNSTSFSQNHRLQVPVAQNGSMYLCGFTADDRLGFSASEDGTVAIWDPGRKRMLQKLEGQIDNPAAISLEKNPRIVLANSKDNRLTVYDIASGKVQFTLKGHQEAVYSACFNKSNTLILSYGADNTAIISDAASGKLLKKLSSHRNDVIQGAFSNDNQYLFTRGRQGDIGSGWDESDEITGKIYIWNLKTGLPIDQIDPDAIRSMLEPAEYFIDAHFLPYEPSLAILTSEGRLLIRNFLRKKYLSPVKVLPTIRENGCLSVAPNGKQLAVSDVAGLVLCDLATLQYQQIENQNDWNHLSINWESQTYACLQPDSSINIYSFKDNKLLYTYRSDDDEPLCLEYNKSGNGLIIGMSSGDIVFLDKNKQWQETAASVLYLLPGDCILSPNKSMAFNGPGYHQVSAACPLYTWHPLTGKASEEIDSMAGCTNAVCFSDNDSLLIIGRTDSSLQILDASYLLPKQIIKGLPGIVTKCQISRDQQFLFLILSDSSVQCRNRKDPDYLVAYKDSGFSPGAMAYDEGRQELIIAGNNGMLVQMNTKTRAVKKMNFQQLENTPALSLQISPDQRNLLLQKTASVGGDGFIYQFTEFMWPEMKVSNYFIERCCTYSFMQYSKDGRYLLKALIPDPKISDGRDGILELLERKTGQSRRFIVKEGGAVICADISPDGQYLAAGTASGRIRIWSLSTGKEVAILNGHSTTVISCSFLADSKTLMSISLDQTVKRWPFISKQPATTIYRFADGSSLSVMDNGYYMGDPTKAAELSFVTQDLEILSFEQLDLQFNRPHQVLEAAGYTDTALISSYRKAWQKRIRSLGADTLRFVGKKNLPVCQIINQQQLIYQQESEKISLHIRAKDSLQDMKYLHLSINGIPLLGKKGWRIPGSKSRYLDTTIVVSLLAGENRILARVSNQQALESSPVPLLLNYTPVTEKKERVYFIGIGVDHFADTSRNLLYCVKDIRDLSARFRKLYGEDLFIDTLFNEEVKIDRIRDLKKMLQTTDIADKVIIAYSGHGILNRDYDYFLSTCNVNFDQPELNGLPYEDLENLLDSIPARKRLLLVDACHSGELDKEELARISQLKDTLNRLGTRGGEPRFHGKAVMKLQSSLELMQSVFANLGRSTGATVITAAGGTQYAMERGELQNGVFTYSIIEAMGRYRQMPVSELKKAVSTRVIQLTRGLQQPNSRSENRYTDWRLW